MVPFIFHLEQVRASNHGQLQIFPGSIQMANCTSWHGFHGLAIFLNSHDQNFKSYVLLQSLYIENNDIKFKSRQKNPIYQKEI